MLFITLLLLSGCSSKVFVESNARSETIDEFYATDRNFVGDSGTGEFYGNDRDTLSVGMLRIERLPGHAIGELKDKSLAGGKRHDFVLRDTALRMNKEAFFSHLFRAADGLDEKRDILLYIHGFNTTFDEAALTMAQVASDLGFRGDALFYSWPSTGQILGYVRDQNNTDWSRKNLTGFLRELAARAPTKSICLLAHSMGNRELLGAFLDLMREQPDLKTKFRVIILAAPDVDSGIFCRDIAGVLTGDGTLVTIYVSRRDKAMKASEKVNGYVRVGDVNGEPLVVPGIDTVDVTNIDTVPMGHSYFANSRLVLSDIYSIINEGVRAESRFSLRPVEYESGGKRVMYWIFER
ncbi:alpha/beta hydrolase [Chlorobaculum sp. 24CR]|uniref:alpha/beta hydrolase n=1 Tax=Chlorobaculum sp. 24CR TaxID=2508878 RepID=UPI00142FD37B|nr:alpha/beta hydrolase [Chlorobaculum sp. 24CR]